MSTIRLTASHPPARHRQPAEPAPPDAIQHGRPRADAPASKPQRRGKAAGALRPATATGSKPSAPPAADQADAAIWREWSGITGVGSFRLPHELLAELDATAHELGLPI